MTDSGEGMLDVLTADGPDPAHAAEMMLYGRFVGAWEGKVIVHLKAGGRREESCEVYFDWVLRGRALQDVWIAPARKDRTDPGRSADKDIYGTTLRVYDRENDVWHITWIEPNTLSFNRMTGKQVGEDIVQEYQEADGSRWEWCFTEITDRSFHWIARESGDDGASWTVRNEFFLHRREQ